MESEDILRIISEQSVQMPYRPPGAEDEWVLYEDADVIVHGHRCRMITAGPRLTACDRVWPDGSPCMIQQYELGYSFGPIFTERMIKKAE